MIISAYCPPLKKTKPAPETDKMAYSSTELVTDPKTVFDPIQDSSYLKLLPVKDFSK